MVALARRMGFFASPEGGRLMAATIAERQERRARTEFLKKAGVRFGEISPQYPMNIPK